MDKQPETGVNKQWAQAETTKDSDKFVPVKVDKIDSFRFAPEGKLLMTIQEDAKNTAQIFWDGKQVGTFSIKDGKTLHFEGNMDESVSALLILLKRFIDNWLQMKKENDGNEKT